MKYNYDDFITYVVTALKGKDAYIEIALECMESYRCGITDASDAVSGWIDSAIEDFCLDNDIPDDYDNPFDTYDVWGKTYDDIFFDALEKME